MTKEKLKIAFEINTKINTFEDAIKTLKNSDLFYIDCFDGSYKRGSIYIPLEIVDFAIDWFTKEKERLDKELEEL